MKREQHYDKIRDRHIISVRDGERSLQMSYTPYEFTFMHSVALESDYLLMEGKLKLLGDTTDNSGDE